MNKAEIIKLIGLMSINYRNWPPEGKEEDTVALWHSMLSDIPFDVGQAAVKAHMSRSVYPPTVADIRDASVMVSNPRTMDAMEAWELINKAIREYGFYRQAEGLASLPDDVREMAERFSWRELCLNDNPDTLRAQFRMAWETQSKRKREESLMPKDVREFIEASGVIKRLE